MNRKIINHIDKCFQQTRHLFILKAMVKPSKTNNGEFFIQTCFFPYTVDEIADYLIKLEIKGIIKLVDFNGDISTPNLNKTFFIKGEYSILLKEFEACLQSVKDDIEHDIHQIEPQKQKDLVNEYLLHKKHELEKETFAFSFNDLPDEKRNLINLYYTLIEIENSTPMFFYPSLESCEEMLRQTKPKVNNIEFIIDYETVIKCVGYIIDYGKREVIFDNGKKLHFKDNRDTDDGRRKNNRRAYELFSYFYHTKTNSIAPDELSKCITFRTPIAKTDKEDSKRVLSDVREALGITADSPNDILKNRKGHIYLRPIKNKKRKK